MELNSKSNIAKWYTYVYSTYFLPDNFCEFFWKLVLTIPIGILMFPSGYFIKREYQIPCIIKVIFNIALLSFTFGLVALPIYFSIIDRTIEPLIPLFIFILLLSSIYILIKNKESLQKESELSKILKAKIHSIKHNYCPKITWKND